MKTLTIQNQTAKQTQSLILAVRYLDSEVEGIYCQSHRHGDDDCFNLVFRCDWPETLCDLLIEMDELDPTRTNYMIGGIQ